ncbi:MAG TPA: hypothetical protein VF396_15050 [Bradyrhizobium sp.]
MTKVIFATAAEEDALRIDEGASSAKPIYTVSLPPARFSADAKVAWDTAPETLRAEVSRMEKEFKAGFAKYKIAAERDASLAEFHEMATKGGTTVKEALSRYVNMENQLRADPIRGLEIICQNVGLSLREVAVLLGATPGQGQGGADSTHDSVVKFAAAHPRFEELSEDIVFFLDTGRADDLAGAYSLAERFSSSTAFATDR